MATADSVKARLQGLIAKANAATGNTDADLTTAIDSLVAGFGQGGIPGVTVIKGTYTHTGRTYQLYIEHNIGEIRPFLFYMKIKNQQDYGNETDIYKVMCGVPTLDAEEVTYLVDGVETTAQQAILTFCFVGLYNGFIRGINELTVLDDATTTSSNYVIKMWPNGFNVGLYRALRADYEYEYTLIYGDWFGGMA